MFERFTDGARSMVVEAENVAKAAGHNFIGTEHLVLAAFGNSDSVAGVVLDILGVKERRLRRVFKRLTAEVATTSPVGHIPFTPNVKRSIERALEQAQRMGAEHIGTEHLLLGILCHEESTGAQMLERFSIEYDMVYAALSMVRVMESGQAVSIEGRSGGTLVISINTDAVISLVGEAFGDEQYRVAKGQPHVITIEPLRNSE